MANNLTGDYEAVLQVSRQQINAILATLHQARMDKDASPSFPHSVSFRIGDHPAAIQHVRDRARFMQWAGKAGGKMQPGDRSAGNLRTILSSKAPPGIKPIFEHAWDDLDQPLLEFLPPGGVHGRVECQISNPTIDVPAGSASEVMVHARVRAHFYPDEGATRLPEPIHGEITALYEVTRPWEPCAARARDLRRQPHPVQGRVGEAQHPQRQVITHVRDALRKQFVALDVNLPGDFAFSEFKSLGSGPTEAVVLPLSLSARRRRGRARQRDEPLPRDGRVRRRGQQGVRRRLLQRPQAVASGRDRRLQLVDLRRLALELHHRVKPGTVEIAGSVKLIGQHWWALDGFIDFTRVSTSCWTR
jgi:hypothetical protein